MLPPNKDLFLKKVIRRGIYDALDGIIATTPILRDYLLKLGIDEDKIFISPPPIDCTFYKPEIHENPISKHYDRCVILYLGSLTPSKFPLDNILPSIRCLKDRGYNFLFQIIGWGNPGEDLEAERIKIRAKQANLNDYVDVSSQILTINEKIQLFKTVDIVILPYQGFQAVDPPITMLEVMSCGKIFVGTRVQSIPHILKDGINGMLLDNRSAEELVRVLSKAIEKKDSKKIRFNARKTVLDNYSYEIVSENLLKVYDHYL